ncbi:MAG: response regulator [Desulfuromonas sp.]|nr:response regulator [Desulfuromonas sp.]
MKKTAVKLLFVEDDLVDRMAFERFVVQEKLSYSYTMASSVAEARDLLQTSKFDIVIADYSLGDGNCFDLFDLLANFPVIITTGMGNEEIAVKAMKSGACDYIIKDSDERYLTILPMAIELAIKRKCDEKELQQYHQRLEVMVAERTAKLQAEVELRSKTEIALRESEKKLNNAQRIAQIGSWDLDWQTQKLQWSDEVYKILALDPQHYIPSRDTYIDKIHPEDRGDVVASYAQALASKKAYEIEYRLQLSDNNEKFVNERAEIICDEQGEPYRLVGTIQDISARKRSDAHKEELEAQLRQKFKMEAIGTMAGGIAHNFNNNLSMILGNIELAKLKEQDDNIVKMLNDAQIATLRARDLIRQILTYSRQGTQNRASLPLPPIIDETIHLLTATIPSTVHITQTICHDCAGLTIDGDPSQIQEALLNLCNNAVFFMDERGQLTISLDSIDVAQSEIPARSTCKPGRYAKLSVQDNGCGIDKKIISKIFDPFFTTKEMCAGIGMGLASVHGIVEQHGGMVKVSSVLQQGSTFELYFPVLLPAQVDEESLEVMELQHGSEKVLFVDDNELLVALGERLLSALGYQVTAMSNSREALKLFSANRDYFDVVVTDQTMPVMSGRELVDELRKLRPDIPIIICTGFSSKIDEEKAHQLGINDFCMKPLDLPELSYKLRKVLHSTK